MRLLKPLYSGLALAMLANARASAAQPAKPQVAAIVAPAAAVYRVTRARSETPKSALGASASAQFPAEAALMLRGTVGALASLPGGDVVSIGCIPMPCPRVAVPDRMYTAELTAVVRIVPIVPLFAIAGAGVVFSQGAGSDSGPGHDRLPPARGNWRLGAELGGKGWWHELRLQWSHAEYAGAIGALRGCDAIAALFTVAKW